jgi:RNA polymerase sigma factor (sigma-70 family)
MEKVIHHLRRAALLHDTACVNDAQLLEAFVAHREEAAFTALVRRHGPAVWATCRRILGNHHDAEDAFQATFLVLASKARVLAQPELLPNWLHGVAVRTASKARVMAARRRLKEKQVTSMPEPTATRNDLPSDLGLRLDEELERLPEKYRVAIVLCDLHGMTRIEAAKRLGWPEGTVAGRLARARALLARRLERHGLVISGTALAMSFGRDAALAQVPLEVVCSTAKVAALFAAGEAAATGARSVGIVALAEGTLKAMFLTKLKATTAALLTAGIFAVASGVFLEATLAGRESRPVQSPAPPGAHPPTPKGLPRERGVPRPTVLDCEGGVTRVAWSPDGKALATVSLTKDTEEIHGKKRTFFSSTVRLWDATKGTVTFSLGEEKKTSIRSLAVSPDGRTMAIAAREQMAGVDPYEVRLVDVRSGDTKKKIRLGTHVRSVLFAPDGKGLAIGGQYNPTDLQNGPIARTILLWDWTQEKLTKEFKQELGLQQVLETGYLDGVRDMAFSPDGRLLATADADWKVRLLDTATGKLRHTLEGHGGVVLGVAFSPDGKTLVSGGFDHTARVWDVPSGKELRALGTKGNVWAVAFSPDGKLVATGGSVRADAVRAGEVVLWNTSTWEKQSMLPDQKTGVAALAFAPGNESILAVATEGGAEGKPSGTVQLWRLADVLRQK